MRIAVLGLGTMGAPMATRLVAAGHDVVVWNRTAERARPLVAAGARAAASPRQAAAGRELVLTLLADEHALEAVLTGDEGLLAGLGPGQIFIEMSTIGRAAALAAAARVEARGAAFLDAPVSGTRGPAVDGRLIVLVGGEGAVLERARPALAVFGEVRHIGPRGAGAALKLVLNALGAQMMLALTSALGLGERLGLERTRMLDAILPGPFGSPLFTGKRARLEGVAGPADFTIELWEKDQRLVLEEAARQGYSMPQLEAVREHMRAAIAQGLGAADVAAIVALFAPAADRPRHDVIV